MSNPNRGRFSIDFEGDYLQYMPIIPDEWEAIGIVARNNNEEKGALLKNKETGVYAMGNYRLIQAIPQHKIQAIMDKKSMKKDGYWNEHRMNKTSVQAFLTEHEIKTVKKTQEKRGFNSYRETLVTLCEEENKRINDHEKESSNKYQPEKTND